MIIVDNLFLEQVSTGFFRLRHFDALCKELTFPCFECCYNFLCHGMIFLFYFPVKRIFFKHRIIFHPFYPVRSVLPVFCGDISRHSRKSALLMFCTFQNYLLSVTFSFLCHFLSLLIIHNVAFFLCFLKR